MKINISEIPDEGLDIDTEEKIESAEVEIVSPAKLRLRIEKSNEEVLIRGTVSAEIRLTCGRCLKDFTRLIESPIDVVYRPAAELRGEEHELQAGELETGFYKGDVLDIDELFVEQMLLGIPIRPLCEEACKGICPVCGTDLNVSGCQCRPSGPPESQMRGLKELKEHLERRKK